MYEAFRGNVTHQIFYLFKKNILENFVQLTTMLEELGAAFLISQKLSSRLNNNLKIAGFIHFTNLLTLITV